MSPIAHRRARGHSPATPASAARPMPSSRAGYEVDLFCLREPGEAHEETWNGIRHAPPAGAPRLHRLCRPPGGIPRLRRPRLRSGSRAEHRRRRYRLVQVATLPDFLPSPPLPAQADRRPAPARPARGHARVLPRPIRQPALLRPLFPLVSGAARAVGRDRRRADHRPRAAAPAVHRARRAPDRIIVVMNSADTRLFDPARHPRRPFMEDGRAAPHPPLATCSGSTAWTSLIEAVARLAEALAARLDIYGDGPFRAELGGGHGRTGRRRPRHAQRPVPIDDLPALHRRGRHRARPHPARAVHGVLAVDQAARVRRHGGPDHRERPRHLPRRISRAEPSATCPAATPTRWPTASGRSPPTRVAAARLGAEAHPPGRAVRVGQPRRAATWRLSTACWRAVASASVGA